MLNAVELVEGDHICEHGVSHAGSRYCRICLRTAMTEEDSKTEQESEPVIMKWTVFFQSGKVEVLEGRTMKEGLKSAGYIDELLQKYLKTASFVDSGDTTAEWEWNPEFHSWLFVGTQK